MRALLFGGTGHVGSAVLRCLAARNVTADFTYHRSAERARNLAAELGHRAHAIDLTDTAAIKALITAVIELGGAPDIFIHCACQAEASRLEHIDDDLWNRVMDVNMRAAFVACRELGGAMPPGGNMVLVAGTDAIPTAPSAPHFAASQAALAGFVRAAAADLGPRNIRINVVALGVLDGGAARLLSPERLELARSYSALGRAGTADEAARAITWVALDNTYMNGAIIALSGGL